MLVVAVGQCRPMFGMTGLRQQFVQAMLAKHLITTLIQYQLYSDNHDLSIPMMFKSMSSRQLILRAFIILILFSVQHFFIVNVWIDIL